MRQKKLSFQIKTIKAAKEAGLREAHKWVFFNLYPTRSSVPIVVKGREFFREEDCEKIASRNYFSKECGLNLIEGAEPVAQKSTTNFGKTILFNVFRISDTVPKKVQIEHPPKIIDDPLLALFVVNRSAKRWREAASAQYKQKNHGLAGYNSQVKSSQYELKDQALKIAVEVGLVKYTGHYNSEMATYEGNGYCFHSPNITPAPEERFFIHDEENDLFVEAKPKDKDEPRLKDAIYTLECFIQEHSD